MDPEDDLIIYFEKDLLTNQPDTREYIKYRVRKYGRIPEGARVAKVRTSWHKSFKDRRWHVTVDFLASFDDESFITTKHILPGTTWVPPTIHEEVEY